MEDLLSADVRIESTAHGRWVVVLTVTGRDGRVDEQRSAPFLTYIAALRHGKNVKEAMDAAKRQWSASVDEDDKVYQALLPQEQRAYQELLRRMAISGCPSSDAQLLHTLVALLVRRIEATPERPDHDQAPPRHR